jgi:GNAT superfamily N-acetyltransferase
MQPTDVEIAPARDADVPLVLALINELAGYEKLQDQVIATEETLRHALFGPRPAAEALIARCDGKAAGFALYFHNFSTFLGKRGLYLEDLFVRPEFRGRAIGKALLARLAQLALERGCGRFEWAVLDWNQPARDFYESLGALANSTWINYRMTGAALERLAEGAQETPRITDAAAKNARNESSE